MVNPIREQTKKRPAWHFYLNVYAEFFSKKNLRRTILISVQWF
ncbi:MAG: hypothetical protein WCF90_04270 [Methanomicrobiales archaeon]